MPYLMRIRPLLEKDYPVVKEIYEAGIKTGNATFEIKAPGWEEWHAKFRPDARFVAEEKDEIKGWAALSQVSIRNVYSGVCEVSVYIQSGMQGRGVGSQLLHHLILCSEEHDIWTLQAGIFPENLASIYLHKKFGFREVGYRERIGVLNGVWRNTLLFERRSKNVGMNE
jgi:L-amino acid N-acyltransferase YncA